MFSDVEIFNNIYNLATNSLRTSASGGSVHSPLAYSIIEILNDVYDAENNKLRIGGIDPPMELAATSDIVPLTVRANTAIGSFPQSDLLDNFNRANAGTLGANWTSNPAGIGEGSLSVAGNVAVSSAAGFRDNWWNADEFGPDVDVSAQITIGTPGADVSCGIVFYARLGNPGGGGDGYYLAFSRNADGNWAFLAASLPGFDILLNTSIPSLSSGDIIGVRLLGSTITAYRNGVSVASVEGDPGTVAQSVGLALSFNDTPYISVDNFSAATLVPQSENLFEVYNSDNDLTFVINSAGLASGVVAQDPPTLASLGAAASGHSHEAVVGNRAAFRARHASSATISNSTFTKMALTVEDLDQGGYFDNATNYRWVPPSGGVHLTARIHWATCSRWGTFAYIYKNGSALVYSRVGVDTQDQSIEVNVSDHANGTDYYECYAYQVSGGNLTCSAANFSGVSVY
jgi:hypothetical protein